MHLRHNEKFQNYSKARDYQWTRAHYLYGDVNNRGETSLPLSYLASSHKKISQLTQTLNSRYITFQLQRTAAFTSYPEIIPYHKMQPFTAKEYQDYNANRSIPLSNRVQLESYTHRRPSLSAAFSIIPLRLRRDAWSATVNPHTIRLEIANRDINPRSTDARG